MTEAPEKLSTREDFQKLVDGYDAWLFDCDGKAKETGSDSTSTKQCRLLDSCQPESWT